MVYIPRTSQSYVFKTFLPKLSVTKPVPGKLPVGYRALEVGPGNQPILKTDDIYWNHSTKRWMITNFAGFPAQLTDQYARRR